MPLYWVKRLLSLYKMSKNEQKNQIFNRNILVVIANIFQKFERLSFFGTTIMQIILLAVNEKVIEVQCIIKHYVIN